jgi:hypothetical protein
MLIRICVFLWLCLCMVAAVDAAGEVPVHGPSTVTAAKAQDLIERASRALQVRFAGVRISELWIFPTADANAVFVHYKSLDDTVPTSGGIAPKPTGHLLLIELHGDDITRLEDFSAPPPAISARAVADRKRSGS